jgi:glutamine amidotransferase
MARVRELGFDALIDDRVRRAIPVLGVCLGMQLLFERSTELGGAEGIGVLAGVVRELPALGVKLPHIGWEPIRWERDTEITDGIDDGTPFYFVHSFAPDPAQPTDVLGTAEHGEPFVCAVERGHVWGVQCHPEKSSAAGLRLYENFARVCAPVAA